MMHVICVCAYEADVVYIRYSHTSICVYLIYTGNDRSDVELANKSSFYEAVYKIHLKQYDEALNLIEITRKKISYAVSTLLTENYSRAYRGMVSMQILSELEEVGAVYMYIYYV